MSDTVNTKHPEYDNNYKTWKKCRDVIAGQKAVKAAKTDYLPQPYGMEDSSYDTYLQRASFYNATGRTVEAIEGQIFRSDPVIETTNNDYLDSITIDNRSFEYYAKKTVREYVSVGRVGTLVDADESGQPYITMYQAESIINWKESLIGGRLKLSLVVLEEHPEKEGQTYSHETERQWRVLKIEEGVYVQELWKEVQNSKMIGEIVKVSEETPMLDGNTFNFIPFFIVPSNSVKKPIIDDIADLNIGHYINSADHENDLHWSGVKTPIVPGWDEDTPIAFGKGLAVPMESKPFILESNGSSILSDELTKKEERMATIGSQILANKGRYIQSAETASINDKGETGVLSSLSGILDDYFYEVLWVCYTWGGWGEVESVSFNKDFEPGNINIDNLIKVFGMISSGQLPEQIGFELLKQYELIDKMMTIEEFREERKKNDLSNLRAEDNTDL